MPAKILLADKSITIQKVVEMLFAGRDYEVVCMSDGETAAKEAQRVAPDIVLADVDLPRVDGYSFAAKLKKTPGLAETPVILMMSRDDVYDHVKGKQAGINDTIVKPFESQELLGKVKKLISSSPPRPEQAASTPAPQASGAAVRAAATPPPESRQIPPNIFDIISDAPSAADLKKTHAPAAEESVYEVEPVVEEVASPFAQEETVLPVGDQALEEMRKGLGLASEEPQPKMVNFESFDADLASMEAPKQQEPTPFFPESAESAGTSEIVTFDNLDMAREAEQMFIPPPQKPVAPTPPPAAPEETRKDLKPTVEEIVTQMTEKYLNDLPLPAPPKIPEEQVRGLIAEYVAKALRENPPSPPKISEETVRGLVAENVTNMAEKAFKEMPMPPMPKISDETIRRALQEAVSAIAKEMARSIIEQVAWEVVPQLAEHLIKEEIERLKAEQ